MTEKNLIFIPRQSSTPATDGCIQPEIGQMLVDYIANELENSIARKVEDHLLPCRSCRENLLKVSKILSPRHEANDKYKDCPEEGAITPKRLKMVRSA